MSIKKTHAIFILDESSSMGLIAQETISAFNQQVETIKENSKDIGTEVSLVTFNTNVNKPIHWKVSVDKVKDLSFEDFQPQGLTALYDAVGTTIDKFKGDPDFNDEEVSFLVVIITDGYENNSKEYGETLPALIKELTDNERWTFTYLGANQDVLSVANAMNINVSNSSSFGATLDGVKVASQGITRGLTAYYSATSKGETQVENFYEDKKED